MTRPRGVAPWLCAAMIACGDEALGAARAEAVRAALIARGVPPDRMQVRALGTAEPLCGEATDPCRARNRRAQLVVLDSRVCK